MDRSICAAIGGRAVVQFSYDGLSRTAELHCHGTSKGSHEVVRAYQVGGYTRSGRVPIWRMYEVSKISGLRQTGETFPFNRPGYNPNDRDMISVHCRV